MTAVTGNRTRPTLVLLPSAGGPGPRRSPGEGARCFSERARAVLTRELAVDRVLAWPPVPTRLMIGYVGRTVARERAVEMAEEIRAEMVANVWKVVASAGDTVSEGDTLVILESMKMEIPVVSESDGVVQELAVNEGDVVQDGDLIAVIG